MYYPHGISNEISSSFWVEPNCDGRFSGLGHRSYIFSVLLQAALTHQHERDLPSCKKNKKVKFSCILNGFQVFLHMYIWSKEVLGAGHVRPTVYLSTFLFSKTIEPIWNKIEGIAASDSETKQFNFFPKYPTSTFWRYHRFFPFLVWEPFFRGRVSIKMIYYLPQKY